MSEKWKLNASPGIATEHTFTVNFTSNSTSYTEISIYNNPYIGDEGADILEYRNNSTDTTVCTYTYQQAAPGYYTWYDESYKTIVLEESATGDLLTWLNSNATKVEPLAKPELSLSNSILTISNIDDNATSIQLNRNNSSYKNLYIINDTYTNVTSSSHDGLMSSDESMTITLSADGTSYKLPESINVTGATGTYTRTDDTTGTLTLSNASGNISFSVEGEAIVTSHTVTINYCGDDSQDCMSQLGLYPDNNQSNYITFTGDAGASVVGEKYEGGSWSDVFHNGDSISVNDTIVLTNLSDNVTQRYQIDTGSSITIPANSSVTLNITKDTTLTLYITCNVDE